MAYDQLSGVLWITEDGSYGGSDIIITNFSSFTEEQIDILDSLGDNSKYPYALAVLNGQDTSEWDG
jgi:hypothetical protein